jgi:seryl-tRNA synthetase
MHDIKWIRENPDEFDKILAMRGEAPKSSIILGLDQKLRSIQTELETLLARRNEIAKSIAQAKSKGEDAAALFKEAEEVKQKIPGLESELQGLSKELDSYIFGLPNLLSDDVPVGQDESSNQLVRTWGEAKNLGFTAKEHYQLGEALGMMDFTQTAKISGARFVTLSGELARLERALAHFMLDIHTKEFGFLEVAPPLIVRDQAMFGAGQLPKFADESFSTDNNMRLIPTSEVSLVNLVADRIVKEEDLPLRFVAYTPCFRLEAGSTGRDTHGMIRQHQFNKVELVSVVIARKAAEEHERMVKAAETVLQRLGIAYRVMLLCSGDTGFCAYKTYDLEVWLPGQGKYREISSCSTTADFQARRLKARYKDYNTGKNQPLHLLNGSGVAVGRALIAILENYQNRDGTITVPEALRPYMGGLEVIKARPAAF